MFGDKELFARRYDEVRYLCFRVAYDLLQDAGLAEDAVHDAFVSVAKHGEKYLRISCSDFRRSIVVIVKNRCIDMLRKSNRNVSCAPDDYVLLNAPDETDIEKQVLQQDDVRYVTDLLNRLDETSRQILVMKYVEGMSYKQIGAQLNMLTKTVATRINRAKQKIRDSVEGGGDR